LFVYIANNLGGTNAGPSAEMVTVPSVINQTAEDAQRVLTDLGLVPSVQFEVNADVEPGLVFEQSPGPDEQAPVDSVVVLKVSQADDTVQLPNVVGSTEDEARAILQGLNLRVVPKLDASDTVPEGVVISMSPDPDQKVNKDTLVTLTISSGPAQVQVPVLAGLTIQEASNLLGQFKLPDPSIVLEASSTVEAGRVIRSDPTPGTPVSIDRKVTLYVSDGPETAQVPPVVGLTQSAAEQAIINKGFTPAFEPVDVAAGSNDVGKVVSQDPGANAKLEKGKEVTIRVGVAVATTTTTAPPTTTTAAPTTTTTTTAP
jgi:serine/threonine-protein kinase